MSIVRIDFDGDLREFRLLGGALQSRLDELKVQEHACVIPITRFFKADTIRLTTRPFYLEHSQAYFRNPTNELWNLDSHGYLNRLIVFTEELKIKTGYWGFFFSGPDLRFID